MNNAKLDIIRDFVLSETHPEKPPETKNSAITVSPEQDQAAFIHHELADTPKNGLHDVSELKLLTPESPSSEENYEDMVYVYREIP